MAVEEAGSTLIYKKPFSFTWTLNSTEVNSMRSKKSLKSPCFSVLLQPPTPSQPELNSLWHLLLWENDMFLCQGWQPDDLYASYVCPPEKGSMFQGMIVKENAASKIFFLRAATIQVK